MATEDDNNKKTLPPGVEAQTDTVTVTVDVPITTLAALTGGDLTTEQSMRAALQYWADMSAANRAEMAHEQATQIQDGELR